MLDTQVLLDMNISHPSALTVVRFESCPHWQLSNLTVDIWQLSPNPKYADYADHADHAHYAEYAKYAEYAEYADYADYA